MLMLIMEQFQKNWEYFDFNTSHVNVNRSKTQHIAAGIEFQYISC